MQLVFRELRSPKPPVNRITTTLFASILPALIGPGPQEYVP